MFTAASLASGLAPAAGALIAARAGQGLGAALLSPAALSIITTSYAGAQRAAALGVWGALGGAGAAVGVLAGGVLTTWLGWRSVFLVNVPVGVVALLSVHLVARDEPRRRFGRELDVPGAALAVAGLVTLAYALAGAPAHDWGSARTLPLLALALLLLAGFATVERSVRRPLVPAQLWRTRSLAAGVLVMFGATGILVGTFFLNSLYLQEVQGVSALRVGLEFLPLALAIGAGAHLASRLLPRAGSRVLIVAGLVMMGAGTLLLTGVSARSGYLTGFLPGLLVIGIGAGVAGHRHHSDERHRRGPGRDRRGADDDRTRDRRRAGSGRVLGRGRGRGRRDRGRLPARLHGRGGPGRRAGRGRGAAGPGGPARGRRPRGGALRWPRPSG